VRSILSTYKLSKEEFCNFHLDFPGMVNYEEFLGRMSIKWHEKSLTQSVLQKGIHSSRTCFGAQFESKISSKHMSESPSL